MAWFRKDSEQEKPEEAEEYNFDFSVLWQDEVQSSFMQYIPHVVEVLLLIWILIKM